MNSKNSNREPHDSERLRAAVAAMKGIDVPAVPELVIHGTRRVIVSSPERRRWTLQVASLAALLAAVALVLIMLLPSSAGSLAFADVAQQVAATRTLRANLVSGRERGTLFVSGARMRFESRGTVVTTDSAAGEEVMLDLREKLAYRIPPNYQFGLADLYGLTQKMAAAVTTPIDDYTDNSGQRYPGHRGEVELAIGGDRIWKVQVSVWSDPQKKLPVRVEIRPLTDGEPSDLIVLDNVEFDLALKSSLFDTSVPPGYTVVGTPVDRLQPAPGKEEAAKLVISPGEGLGDIRFEMSLEKITAILGQPEFIQHGVYLCYPSKGLQLVLTHEGGGLQMIIANPSDAASLVKHDFPGRTDQGIRIGSSEQQVRQAYGEPDPPLPGDQQGNAGPHIARYDRLGLMFGFTDGKVQQIIIAQ